MKYLHLSCYLLFANVLCVIAENSEQLSEVETNFDFEWPQDHAYTVRDHGKVVACFFNSESYKKKNYDIEGDAFEGNFCTHLVYKFGVINYTLNTISVDDLGLCSKVTNLKSKYPHMKILLGIGGSHGSQKIGFNQIVKEHNRQLFAKNAVSFIRNLSFDGLHLNWQFPHESDRNDFTNLARELKTGCQKNQILLTTTMGGIKEGLRTYDVFQVTRLFDLVFIQAYGYFSRSSPLLTNHLSSLYGSSPRETQQKQNTFDILEYILFDEYYANPDNLVLGIPFYAEMYSLTDKNSSGIYGFKKPAKFLKKLGYGQMCKLVISDNMNGNESLGWKQFWDNKSKASFCKSEDRWLTFINPKSIYEKMKTINQFGLRGVMVSSIDYDDYLGHCSNNSNNINPLLKSVNFALMATKNQSRSRLCDHLDNKSSFRSLFTPNFTEMIISEGEDAHIHCFIEGNPPPNVTWYIINEGGRTTIPEQENVSYSNLYFTNTVQLACRHYQKYVSVLTVEKFNRKDVKDYYCESTSGQYQSHTQRFTLTILKTEYVSIWAWIAGFLMVVLCILPLLMVFYKKYRAKLVLTTHELKKFFDGGDMTSKDHCCDIKLVKLGGIENPDRLPYNQAYEISKKDYTLEPERLLGSGAFGLVFRGTVLDEDVAVKSLKNEGDRMSLLSLLSELKILIYLENHDNIINLIGAYTKEVQTGVVYLFVEYCPHGNLLDYLQNHRKSFTSLLCNDYYTLLHTQELADVSESISEENLVQWSLQVANGLQYLRTKKVIHGDLAARNILVFAKDSLKITDFGLSRKLYVFSNYKYKKTNYEEPLPWRWMALESLRDLEFSFESDIWAFGVTMWEIFSLGETPYAAMTWTLGFLEDLKKNFRLQKPNYATTSIYLLMLKCWNPDPKARPKANDLQECILSAFENQKRVTLKLENELNETAQVIT